MHPGFLKHYRALAAVLDSIDVQSVPLLAETKARGSLLCAPGAALRKMRGVAAMRLQGAVGCS